MQNNKPTQSNIKLGTNDHLYMPCNTKNYFTSDECQKILKQNESFPLITAVTGAVGREKANEEIRKTEVRWFKPNTETSWVFKKLWASILQVNQYYKYEIRGIEVMQIAKYTNGGFYDWHMDLGRKEVSRRKLSISVQLSNANDYEGGELQFFDKILHGQYTPPKEIGSAIIFPSFLPHRVTPVTKGTRWSLVAWIFGPPFR